jgi:hypothetical protein
MSRRQRSSPRPMVMNLMDHLYRPVWQPGMRRYTRPAVPKQSRHKKPRSRVRRSPARRRSSARRRSPFKYQPSKTPIVIDFGEENYENFSDSDDDSSPRSPVRSPPRYQPSKTPIVIDFGEESFGSRSPVRGRSRQKRAKKSKRPARRSRSRR